MLPASSRSENDAGWASCFHHLAGRRELAGRLIDLERDDAVALQVCRVEQVARRIEGEKTRRAALRRIPGKGCEPTIRRIDTEDDDAVVPAVRDVDETSRARDFDFGGGIVAHECLGQRRYHLKRLEFAALGIPDICSDGGI